MERKDFFTIGIAGFAALVSVFSAIAAIKSCNISKEISDRYYKEIEFKAFYNNKNVLTIEQLSGTTHILKSVDLIPYYSLTENSPFKKGQTCSLDLSRSYERNISQYIIPDIKKKICMVQQIQDCEKQHIFKLEMKYRINEVDKVVLVQNVK